MEKQMLFIQLDTLRFIVKDLEENERSNEFIILELEEIIENIKHYLGDE